MPQPSSPDFLPALPKASTHSSSTSHALAPLHGQHRALRGPHTTRYPQEEVTTPTISIRRGRWKFIQTPHLPHQLYDLWADPAQTHNLAASPAYAEVTQAFQTEILQHWDFRELRRRIRARQQKRSTAEGHRAAEQPSTWSSSPCRRLAPSPIHRLASVAE